jgi:antitoxin FitA
MAQLIVRNLEMQTKMRLQRRAKRHGRSMEEEARDILRDALKDEGAPKTGLGSEIAALFRGKGLDCEITELRGHAVKPLNFEP